MELREVNSRRTWNQFLQLPFRIFENDVHWIAPLLSEQRRILDVKKNPYFKHCSYRAWLVMAKEKPVGRIITYIDTLYNDINNATTGFFGFFECINDHKAASMLFEAGRDWFKENGITQMCGPMNFSLGNECGIQLSGYEFPPCIQMNHTPAYYQHLFEEAGYSKVHDLYAYRMTDRDAELNEALLQSMERICNKAVSKQGVALRSINLKNYKKELEHVHALFNDCMNQAWGFVPANFEEMLFGSKSLKKIADEELILFAEVNGKVIGCSVAIPDVNQAMKHLKDGKLFPFGFIKFLYHLKKINGFRLLFLGVHPGYRLKGLDALFYYNTIRKGIKRGYKTAELSWIAENNQNLIKIVEKIGAQRYKTYRFYQKNLA